MLLSELLKGRNIKDFCSYPGSPPQKLEVAQILFSNLLENKVVYWERFMGVVELSDIQLTERGFSAYATPVKQIIRGDFFLDRRWSDKKWRFSTTWDSSFLCNGALTSPYVSWSVYPESEFVSIVLEFLNNNDNKSAIDLVYDYRGQEGFFKL